MRILRLLLVAAILLPAATHAQVISWTGTGGDRTPALGAWILLVRAGLDRRHAPGGVGAVRYSR